MTILQSLTILPGWCSMINLIVLCIASILLTLLRGSIVGIHSRMFSVGSEEMSLAYVQYLSNYKIAIIMLNVVPYVALKVMAG